MKKTKQELIEQNLCNYYDNEFINDCKLTKILKTDTGYYVEADATFKVGVDNYEEGWLTADLEKDLSVKNIKEYEY